MAEMFQNFELAHFRRRVGTIQVHVVRRWSDGCDQPVRRMKPTPTRKHVFFVGSVSNACNKIMHALADNPITTTTALGKAAYKVMQYAGRRETPRSSGLRRGSRRRRADPSSSACWRRDKAGHLSTVAR